VCNTNTMPANMVGSWALVHSYCTRWMHCISGSICAAYVCNFYIGVQCLKRRLIAEPNTLRDVVEYDMTSPWYMYDMCMTLWNMYYVYMTYLQLCRPISRRPRPLVASTEFEYMGMVLAYPFGAFEARIFYKLLIYFRYRNLESQSGFLGSNTWTVSFLNILLDKYYHIYTLLWMKGFPLPPPENLWGAPPLNLQHVIHCLCFCDLEASAPLWNAGCPRGRKCCTDFIFGNHSKMIGTPTLVFFNSTTSREDCSKSGKTIKLEPRW